MARDVFHEIVKEALIKDGWIVTHDPLTLLNFSPKEKKIKSWIE
jgi:XisH protein